MNKIIWEFKHYLKPKTARNDNCEEQWDLGIANLWNEE